MVFLTRLPVGLGRGEGRGEGQGEGQGALARAAWCFPLVGLLVGLVSAAGGLVALWCGLTGWIAAGVALAASASVTGALHEDGLADMADGFGGGWTRDRRLEIMRDSRLGSYGALALGLSLLLRAAALAALAETGALTFALAVLAAQAGARAPLPLFMALTPLARREGQSASAGRPRGGAALLAAGLGLLLLVVVGLLLGGGLDFPVLAALLLAAAFLAIRALARRKIGGYTGDVLGGLEQSSEVLLLLAAVALYA